LITINLIASLLFTDIHNKFADNSKALNYKNLAAKQLSQLVEVRANAEKPPAEEQYLAKIGPFYEREMAKQAKALKEPGQKILDKGESPRGLVTYLVLKKYVDCNFI
jgi:hypothetical protein